MTADEEARAILAKLPRDERLMYERFSSYARVLEEFRYGAERLRGEPADPPTVARMFYYHAIMEYLYSLLLANGAMARLTEWLTQWGLAGHAARIEEILGRRVGPHPFRQRLLDIRGRMLGHFDFTGEGVRELMRKHDSANNRPEYAATFDELVAVLIELADGAIATREGMRRKAQEL